MFSTRNLRESHLQDSPRLFSEIASRDGWSLEQTPRDGFGIQWGGTRALRHGVPLFISPSYFYCSTANPPHLEITASCRAECVIIGALP